MAKRSKATVALAGWDPAAKDDEVEVECDSLTSGCYKLSCASTERAWIGIRGRPGLVSGSYCFEVKVTEGLLRVGWASGTAALSLGTDDEGFGYGGTGKRSHRNKFADYGVAFEAGDIVTCCIDRQRREIGFGVNGTHYGPAFNISKAWDGYALFPALCAREAFKATGYFGFPEHPKVPHGCGYWPMGDAYPQDIVESDGGPPSAAALPLPEESAERKSDRAARFQKLARVDQDLKKLSTYDPAAAVDSQASNGVLVGRSRALERGYLRDAVKLRDPAHIRPLPVLKEALEHTLSAKRPWAWEAEMLRAIRQDLTVQHVGGDFMEEVCEISALRALRNSDWSTFAACAPTLGKQRACAGEFIWLLFLGVSALSRSCGLLSASVAASDEKERRRSPVEEFVKAVLADVSAGRWTRVLRRTPPTEAAGWAFRIVVQPLAVAKVLAVATKAVPRISVARLKALGVEELPGGVEAVDGFVDGRKAHVQALLQVEAAQRPTQRDDHTEEFLR